MTVRRQCAVLEGFDEMIWPFSRRSDKPTHSAAPGDAVRIEFTGRMVRIPSREFFGAFAKSPNGAYLLAWRDADPNGRRGGFRESGKGDYVLAHGGRIVADGRMERPNDGKVADNGTFILSDWRFGDQLRSTLYAFDNQGRQLLSHEFSANALNSGLSQDGRFAVYMTAGGDGPDTSKMSLFDLTDGECLWSLWPVSGRPTSYAFDTVEALLWLEYEGKGRYAYSMTDGDFLDRERWETERIEWAHPFELARIGSERLKAAGDDLDLRDGAEIAFILKKAIATGIDQSPSEHAKVLKTLGDLWERLGDDREALNCFQQAEAAYPKAGVKRRIQALRKQLEG